MISRYSAYIVRNMENGNIRYYRLNVDRTLFDTYCVERKYGNVRYKSPTGTRINHFELLEQALGFFDKMLRQKLRRGYAEPKLHIRFAS